MPLAGPTAYQKGTDNMDEVVIRNAVAEDAATLSRIYEFYVCRTAITFEDDAPDERQFSERMKNIMRFYPYFVAEIGGKVVGYAYASQFKNRSAYETRHKRYKSSIFYAFSLFISFLITFSFGYTIINKFFIFY